MGLRNNDSFFVINYSYSPRASSLRVCLDIEIRGGFVFIKYLQIYFDMSPLQKGHSRENGNLKTSFIV